MENINKQAPRLWLFGIAASLAVNLHKMQQNFMQRQVQMKLMVQGESGGKMLLDKEMKKVTKDTLQDLIDLVIPLSIIGWLDLTPGTVGLAGSITSLMGAVSLYPTN
jgi:peroxin-11B